MFAQFLLLASLLIRPIDAGCSPLEEAQALVAQFKSLVGTSISDDKSRRTEQFLQNSLKWGERLVPFADLFARGLNGTLEPKQREAVLTLTRGISQQVRETKERWRSFERTYKYVSLGELAEGISFPLIRLLHRFDQMSIGESGTSQYLIDVFSSSCTMGSEDVWLIAFKLASMARNCQNAVVSAEVVTKIYDYLLRFEYTEHQPPPTTPAPIWFGEESREAEFDRKFATLYHRLASRPSVLHVLDELVDSHRGEVLSNRNKALDLVIGTLQLDPTQPQTSWCLASAIFVADGFRRAEVQRFMDGVMDSVQTLIYLTRMCAITRESPREVEVFADSVLDELPVVYGMIERWLDRFLDSTWPTIEDKLIEAAFIKAADGKPIPVSNQTYQSILTAVEKEMEDIGDPRYHRGYIITDSRAASSPDVNERFAGECLPGKCIRNSLLGATCIVTRTGIHATSKTRNPANLANFIQKTQPIFSKAMQERLQSLYFVTMAVKRFKEADYGVNLDRFPAYSTYVILRTSRWGECRNSFATSMNYHQLEPPLIGNLSYYRPGGWFKKCQDWVIFLVC